MCSKRGGAGNIAMSERSAEITPSSGARGVDETFNAILRPDALSTAATSVKVPPTSMPTRKMAPAIRPTYSVLERYLCVAAANHDVLRSGEEASRVGGRVRTVSVLTDVSG